MKSHENFNNTNFTHRFWIKAIYFFGKWVTMSVLKWTRISALTKMAFERHPIAFFLVRVDLPLIADHTTISMTCERLNTKPWSQVQNTHVRTSSDLREHINVSVGSTRVIFRRRQSVTRLGKTPKIILSTIKLRSASTVITLAQDTFIVLVRTRKSF